MTTHRLQQGQTVSAEMLEDRLNMYINAVERTTASCDHHESSHLQRDIQILMDLMERIHTGQVVMVTEVPPSLVPPSQIDMRENILEELRTRLSEYHKALYFAEEELSEERIIKVKNLQRGLQTINELQRRAQAGVPVRPDEIPPRVSIPSDEEFDVDAVKTLSARLGHLRTVLASETQSKKVAKLQSVIRTVEFLLTRAHANRPVWKRDIPLESDYPVRETKKPKVASVNKAKLTLQLRSLQQRLDSISLSEQNDNLNELKRKMKAIAKEIPHIQTASDIESQLEFLSQEVGTLEQAVFAEKTKVFNSVSDNLSITDLRMTEHKVEDFVSKHEGHTDQTADCYKVSRVPKSPSQEASSVQTAKAQLFPVDIRNCLDTDEDKLAKKLFSYLDKESDQLSSKQQLFNLNNKVDLSQHYLSKVQNSEIKEEQPVLLKNGDVGLHKIELNLFRNGVLPDSSEKNIANLHQHKIGQFKDNSVAKDFPSALNINDHKEYSALNEAITGPGFSTISSDTTLPRAAVLHQNPFTIASLQDQNSDSVKAANTSLSFRTETMNPEKCPSQLSSQGASMSNMQFSDFIPENVGIIMGHNQMLPYSSDIALSADNVPSNSVFVEDFRSLDITSTDCSNVSTPSTLYHSLPYLQTLDPYRITSSVQNQSYGTIIDSKFEQQNIECRNSENYLPINKLNVNNTATVTEINDLEIARNVVKTSPETLEFQDLMRSMTWPSETLAAPSGLSSESLPLCSEQVVENLSNQNSGPMHRDAVSLNLNPASNAQVSKNVVLTARQKSSSTVPGTHTLPFSAISSEGRQKSSSTVPGTHTLPFSAISSEGRQKSSSALPGTHTLPFSAISSEGSTTTETIPEIKSDSVNGSVLAHSTVSHLEVSDLDHWPEEVHLEGSTQDIRNPQLLNEVVTVESEELPKDPTQISSAVLGQQPSVKASTLETATMSQASISFESNHIGFTCLENLKYDYLLSRTKTSEESRWEEEKIKTKLEQIKQALRQGGKQTWEVYKACVERELASINQQIEDVRLLQQWRDLQMLTEKKQLAERELTVLRVCIPHLQH